MSDHPKFTIFTPTYNRADLISRVYESLSQQNFLDFEWLIIDDGSTDNTEHVISDFKRNSKFPIFYLKKENEGKVAAINDALNVAKGEWFIVFDSDDWCDPDALEIICREIKKIPDNSYAAISVLKRDIYNKVIGDDYSNIEKYNNTYLDRAILGIKGDKWEIIKTDVHKNYRYELKNGDKYMAPSFVWLMLAKRYKTVFLNQALSTIEYQSNGISKNNIKHRVGSCESTIFYYQEIYKIVSDGKFKRRLKINEMRFKLHKSFFIEFNFIYLFSFILYISDKVKLRG